MTANPVFSANWGVVAALFVVGGGAILSACRNDAPATSNPGDASATPPAEATPTVPTMDASPLDEDFEPPSRPEHRRDGGVDPACEGKQLSLLASAADPRCAITEREWNARARPKDAGAGTGGGALRQEARREGERIVLSIVNAGASPLVVPLRYHPGHPEMAFSVLAVAAPPRHGVFELEPPREPEVEAAIAAKPSPRARRRGVFAELDAGPIEHVYIAQIRLLPGGRATARLVVDPRIAKRLDRTCAPGADAGAADAGEPCLPSQLAAGRVVLHLGQLVAGIESGPPARVEWEAP